MDKLYATIIDEKRKRGQHLGAEERGAIQQLKKLGYSNRAIAREINCSSSTAGYELNEVHPHMPVEDANRAAPPSEERQYIVPIAAVALNSI